MEDIDMDENMRVLPVRKDGKFCYNIILKADFTKLGEQVKTLGVEGRKLCIVADAKAGELYGEAVRAELLKVTDTVELYTIPSGEEYKTLDTVRRVYAYLIEKHYDRKDMLVALGGGVTGDLTGFTAATYLRGIGFIQIPTTLLSQVDSSIGGKTGVDFDSYKNMVGAFHMPRLVYINPAVLKPSVSVRAARSRCEGRCRVRALRTRVLFRSVRVYVRVRNSLRAAECPGSG